MDPLQFAYLQKQINGRWRCSGNNSALTHLEKKNNTGAPQGCVLSPLLYSHSCVPCSLTHKANIIFKFAEDTIILGLLTDGDERAYRDEWCNSSNLCLNKTKEMIMEYWRLQGD